MARAVRYGSKLAAAARGIGLRIADKTRVVASSFTTAKSVAEGIRSSVEQVPIVAAQVGEDLGVATTAGRRRTLGSFAKRLAKAGRRARRVGKLVEGGPSCSTTILYRGAAATPPREPHHRGCSAADSGYAKQCDRLSRPRRQPSLRCIAPGVAPGRAR